MNDLERYEAAHADYTDPTVEYPVGSEVWVRGPTRSLEGTVRGHRDGLCDFSEEGPVEPTETTLIEVEYVTGRSGRKRSVEVPIEFVEVPR